ncbi:MAG: C25 family cysteine peptidase [Candidatus Neomarinimicrobiota bacterium]|nr:C25 family cysteine peptidase [Candidatus Neomarinimicrobiota bacterium]
MRHTQKLILFLLPFSFLFGEGVSFRGKTKDQLMGQAIPLAFTNMVTTNYNILPSQINPQRGSYMIIAPDGVSSYLADFVAFKNSQGFDVYVVPLSNAGDTADDIKTTISNQLMEDPMLEYVLLIGDVDGFAEIPSFYFGPENDVTDQEYTHILGDDHIPDIFIGRLSIDSLSDLAVIMSKTIQYARDPLAYDESWLDRGLIVAGNYSNTYPIPITPKWTSYWLRDELLDYGYSQIDTVFYPPVQQGAPYIIESIDNGVGIVNYRGWGDANGWHYPEFHVDDVNDLNNGWLTPVFMSYVCNSNDFANNVDPCLSEAVLRGGTPTVPKGGVAFIGPSDLHTSTKYNNVINAYMYDAMLNHGVMELGPAMQAGQSGLIKEFPEQNGPGEAQEFYAQVYNILGDPSLQVYVDTPNQFDISVEEITASDDFIKVSVSDLGGNAIDQAVISIMEDGILVAKGITDQNGQFAATLQLNGTPTLDIYANKDSFIQGHEITEVQPVISDLYLVNLNITTENGNEKPGLGELMSCLFMLENGSTSTSDAFTGTLSFSQNVVPNSINVEIPSIMPGETTTISNIEIVAYGTDISHTISGTIADGGGNTFSKFAIDVELPVFEISFENQPLPGSEFEPTLSMTNYSPGTYTGVWLELSALSDGAEVTLNVASDLLADFAPFSTISNATNYYISIGDVAYGSDITFLVDFQKSGHTIYSQEVPLHIEPTLENLPVAPTHYGYWAYDDTDTGFDHTPVFNWVELDPAHGGSNGTYYQLDDDDHVDIELPFVFKYHGIDYQEITVSSNGWTSFEPCYIDYFWNMSIPMYMGPKAMLAPFSDDLETIDSNGDGDIDVWIHVFTWYDDANGRFVIEWSRALNGYDETTEETFEVILYDQNALQTESGNGVIDFQYLEIEDVDATKNYSTVGIESPEKNYGLQYVFNNVYAPGAAPLENERAIRFTTEAPDNYVAPLSVDDTLYPNVFSLSPAYPNPFNPTTQLDLKIGRPELVKVAVVDILGREVAELQNGYMVPGQYTLSWNGTNRFGITISSGTYFVVLDYGEKTKIQKLLFLK